MTGLVDNDSHFRVAMLFTMIPRALGVNCARAQGRGGLLGYTLRHARNREVRSGLRDSRHEEKFTESTGASKLRRRIRVHTRSDDWFGFWGGEDIAARNSVNQ